MFRVLEPRPLRVHADLKFRLGVCVDDFELVSPTVGVATHSERSRSAVKIKVTTPMQLCLGCTHWFDGQTKLLLLFTTGERRVFVLVFVCFQEQPQRYLQLCVASRADIGFFTETTPKSGQGFSPKRPPGFDHSCRR